MRRLSLRQKFYYRGTKLIFTRRGAIARIRARVAAGGAPLTRAEFRLIATQRDDITKCVFVVFMTAAPADAL